MILLFRHGNTFVNSQEAYWVGKHQDLPLTNEGRAQASVYQEAFSEVASAFDHVYAAPLLRTKEFAEIITRNTPLSVTVDERLSEIDYGHWGGLTNDEISVHFGKEMLANWRELGLYPPDGIWGETSCEVAARVASFIDERSDESYAVVSSNGILREFLKRVPPSSPSLTEVSTPSVKTGNFSLLSRETGNAYAVCTWNSPADLFRSYFK